MGLPLSSVGTDRHFSDHERVEQELIRREASFRALFENAAVGMVRGRPDGQITHINPKLTAMLGYTLEEIQRLGIERITHPDDFAADLAQFTRLLSGEFSSYDLEKRFICKNGEIRWTQITVTAMKEDANVVEIYVVVQDVHTRKQAEEELRLSERRFRTFVEHATDAFLLHDERGFVVDCNEQACRSLGYSRQELFGMNPVDFNPTLTPGDIERTKRQLAAGEVVTFDSRHRRKDGGVFPVEVRIRAVELNGKQYYLALVRDTTYRKQAEERVSDLQNRLAHANRYQSMGEIASGIAHELSQPLAAIHLNAGGARLLSERLELPEMFECMQQIEKQSFRAGEIIRRLRSFICRDHSQRAKHDVNRLVEEVLALTADYLGQHAVEVEIKLGESLAAVEVDAVQIQQVLVNLIRNAVDATAQNADRKRIVSVCTEGADRTVKVSVSDNGCGVDPAGAERLFFPFHTTKPTGMGLGLSISRTIIDAHGGQIRFQSNSPQGATFFFLLPAAL